MDAEAKLKLIERIVTEERLALEEAWLAIGLVLDGENPYDRDSDSEVPSPAYFLKEI